MVSSLKKNFHLMLSTQSFLSILLMTRNTFVSSFLVIYFSSKLKSSKKSFIMKATANFSEKKKSSKLQYSTSKTCERNRKLD